MKPKTLEQLPDAWLCRDDLYVLDSFDSREEAEGCKGTTEGVRVAKDSPELRVRVDGINIFKPRHITMRENWLKRNYEFVKPCLANEREAIVFTWEEGAPQDVIASRLGGVAPLIHDEEWHCCEQCGQPFTFVGTLDFRETPFRSAVPADAMTYFQCFNFDGCDWFENAVVGWLNAEEKITLKSPPQGSKGKTSTGMPWLVKDYSIDDIEYFENEDSLKKQFDLLGDDPYFNVHANAVKIGGHPFWIQGEEESKGFLCSCGQPMSFIAQFIEHEEIEFGDSGTAYIIACATNTCSDYNVIIQIF